MIHHKKLNELYHAFNYDDGVDNDDADDDDVVDNDDDDADENDDVDDQVFPNRPVSEVFRDIPEQVSSNDDGVDDNVDDGDD